MRIAAADAVRAAIAEHLAGSLTDTDSLGDVVLHAHQRSAVDRVSTLIDAHGGALLADDVGLGKTYVALAIARRADRPLVLAPAALRDTWIAASRRAGIVVQFASVESLGRGEAPRATCDLVIVDEAHHLRSADTRRYAVARAICQRAKVLLLSATPVQNGMRDVRNVLALFLGQRAHAASDDDLARFVVRRLADDLVEHAVALPSVAGPRWVHGVSDADCLDRLLAMPPPVPPSDGGDGGALLTYSLVRQWASSRAAFHGALTRRLARASALEDALAAGRWPSRAELASWHFADGAMQLAFPELLVPSGSGDSAELLHQVRVHADGVRDLLAWLHHSPNPDPERAERLLAIRARHPEERVVVFSEYADTIATMYRALLPRERVAMLSRGGGRVAGGPISRAELLAQFGPFGDPRESDRVDVLLTTDVLSEGVDLQRASVVVHLDLAWNPARLEQRVGRLRRLGAARDRVSVYAFAPPAPAERLLQLERRLRVKLGAAASSVGLAGAIVPGLDAPAVVSPVARAERMHRAIRGWRRDASRVDGPIAAAVRSTANGVLACVRRGGGMALVAMTDDGVRDAIADVEPLVLAASGADATLDPREALELARRVQAWLSRGAAAQVLDLPVAHIARSRHRVLRRVHSIARRARRHERGNLGAMLRAARTVATATLSAGAERVLDELARAEMPDVAWLQSIGQFAALHARASDAGPDAVLALLVLRAATSAES